MVGIRTVIYVFAAIIGACTVWLAWQNRGSENVQTNFPTALALGVLGALLTLVFSLKGDEQETSFAVEYVLDAKSRLPMGSEAWEDSLIYTDPGFITVTPAWLTVSSIPDENADTVGSKTDAELVNLYRRVLTRQMLDALNFTFSGSWDVNVTHIDLPTGGIQSYSPPRERRAGVRLTHGNLAAVFANEKVYKPDPQSMPFNLPPQTTVTFKTDDNSYTVTFTNPFATITISISDRGIEPGLGVMRPMARIGYEADKLYRRPRYLITATAKFSQLYSGHPDMPLYKHWGDVIFKKLKRFDSQDRWQTFSQKYLLFYAGGRTQTPMDELIQETDQKAKAVEEGTAPADAPK